MFISLTVDIKQMRRVISVLFVCLCASSAPAHATGVTKSTFTQVLPDKYCGPTAPSSGCITTQPLDLRGITRFRLSVQANNIIGLGQPSTPAVLRLQDANNLSAGCFGAKCPTLAIQPVSSFPLGSCCAATHRTLDIPVPPAHRRQNVQLRLTQTGGGNLLAGEHVPPEVQFFSD